MVVELLATAGGDAAAVEGDVERVECGLPAVGPAGAALAGGVKAADGQVQHFQRRLFGGEIASSVDDFIRATHDAAVSTSKPRNGTISAHALVHSRTMAGYLVSHFA